MCEIAGRGRAVGETGRVSVPDAMDAPSAAPAVVLPESRVVLVDPWGLLRLSAILSAEVVDMERGDSVVLC